MRNCPYEYCCIYPTILTLPLFSMLWFTSLPVITWCMFITQVSRLELKSSIFNQKKMNSCLFSISVIFLAKMLTICWFQLLKWNDFLHFSQSLWVLNCWLDKISNVIFSKLPRDERNWCLSFFFCHLLIFWEPAKHIRLPLLNSSGNGNAQATLAHMLRPPVDVLDAGQWKRGAGNASVSLSTWLSVCCHPKSNSSDRNSSTFCWGLDFPNQEKE